MIGPQSPADAIALVQQAVDGRTAAGRPITQGQDGEAGAGVGQPNRLAAALQGVQRETGFGADEGGEGRNRDHAKARKRSLCILMAI